MTTYIHFIHPPKNVQIGWGHHAYFRVWKNRPLLLAKGVEFVPTPMRANRAPGNGMGNKLQIIHIHLQNMKDRDELKQPRLSLNSRHAILKLKKEVDFNKA